MMKQGLLLINLGTPEAPTRSAVRQYLKTFLFDKHVIDLPAYIRFILLYGFILPTRVASSTKAYQSIWQAEGSPLRYVSQNLVKKLQAQLAGTCDVALGMRYGEPSLATALEKLAHCDSLIILPLYPQYAQSTSGSSIEKVFDLLRKRATWPHLRIIRDFYHNPFFLQAMAERIKPYLADHDYVLFSYHGLPVRHIIKSGCAAVCTNACPDPVEKNPICYRAQCYATTHALASILQLADHTYATSFQSRLGRTPWITPYTEDELKQLAAQGIKRLAIALPSFVTDCLETLEEIAIRAKEQWLALGGDVLTAIPCLNDEDAWVNGIIKLCHLA